MERYGHNGAEWCNMEQSAHFWCSLGQNDARNNQIREPPFLNNIRIIKGNNRTAEHKNLFIEDTSFRCLSIKKNDRTIFHIVSHI